MALAALCAGCGGGSAGNGNGSFDPPRVTGITVVAGNAVEFGIVDGAGSSARFRSPSGVAIDSSGNVFVADASDCTIRKITAAGQVSTVAGAAGMCDTLDGIGPAARLNRPIGLAFDTAGSLLFTEGLSIRKLSPAGLVTTVTSITIGSNNNGRSDVLFYPTALAVTGNGDIYTTTGIGTRKISAAGTTMIEGVATMDLPVGGTRLAIPRGITIDSGGTVYVADLRYTISKLGPDGKLTTFVGSPDVAGSADGTGAAASFSSITSLAFGAAGNLYAADTGNSLIRKITPAGVVTTLAGTRGSRDLHAGPLPGSLAGVSGLAVDKNGNIFATSGHAVIKVTP